MARLDISAQSTEWVRVAISAKESGVRVDPTTSSAQIAFVARGDDDGGPTTGDWLDAEWETAGTQYYARTLVGPSGNLTLNKGYYRIWVKLSIAPEAPVMAAGTLYVY